ncbi:M48 family metallopeptidase [Paraneptunicella aestuarii]|uniref:M48 family metallopeptidase n=1 Tax=Paraneptunicella aestuarii TaxID=2831148 RepID=UPI001E4E51D8|nr:M48 family metallopeptidase [Paraneptunicella aestuarii]UAA37651.1 M48 family metallopeptidase [Paraneptunicella aestuarii]
MTINDNRTWLTIILVALLTIAVSVYQFFVVGVPYLSEQIASALPAKAYEYVDEAALKSLSDSDFKPSKLSDERQNEIKALFTRLTENLDTERQFQLKFKSWEEKPNAFAFANGTIVMTDKMIELAENDQEIEAILLHEIGHVTHNHVMENLVGMSVVSVTVSLIIGDISALSDILVQGATFGISLNYSRDAELEADHYASEKLTEIYGNTEAIVSIFSKLKEFEDDSQSWLSTHPDLDDRIQIMQQH